MGASVGEEARQQANVNLTRQEVAVLGEYEIRAMPGPKHTALVHIQDGTVADAKPFLVDLTDNGAEPVAEPARAPPLSGRTPPARPPRPPEPRHDVRRNVAAAARAVVCRKSVNPFIASEEELGGGAQRLPDAQVCALIVSTTPGGVHDDRRLILRATYQPRYHSGHHRWCPVVMRV